MFPELSSLKSDELVEKIQRNENADYCFYYLFKILRPLIKHTAKPYLPYLPLYNMDDMLQEGRILLWKIVYKYNLNGNVSFDSYFGSCYKNRCNKLYRSSAKTFTYALPEDCPLSQEGFQIYVPKPPVQRRQAKKSSPKGSNAAVDGAKKCSPNSGGKTHKTNAAGRTSCETQILSPEQQAQKIMKLQKRREHRWMSRPIPFET